ncbi:hypothetical protein [Streptomyces sp. NBC_01500]|uniref:hypothetical protein n=1 Tax=Streptomyces sp. NBC_01500 TaxID=2903886 RepID=UPI002255930C|nr:hypothetical protein [Streptomyces sp. NBC_01500]MCX4549462.1 hypothetical protein [Streptomyces sp. NBC_01500]
MSPRPAPRLKSPPPATADRAAADRPASQTAGRVLKVVAEGVPTAVRPDPQTSDGRYPVAWLTISAPRGTTPTATSKCACGRDRSAVGHRKVLALINDHTAHRDRCPLRAPQDQRNAA